MIKIRKYRHVEGDTLVRARCGACGKRARVELSIPSGPRTAMEMDLCNSCVATLVGKLEAHLWRDGVVPKMPRRLAKQVGRLPPRQRPEYDTEY